MKASPISSGHRCAARRLASVASVANVVALVWFATPGVGRAADPRAEAKADLVAGMSLLDKGDNQGALRKFEAAFALVPSPKVQFNMGLALQGLERNIEALQAFDRFLEGAIDVPQEKRDQAEKHRRILLARVASITISADLAGVEVTIDGVSRGKTPFARPLYVEAGSHQLVAQKPGWTPAPQSFAATRGAELTIPIVLVAALKPAPITRLAANPFAMAPTLVARPPAPTPAPAPTLTSPPMPVEPTAVLVSVKPSVDVAVEPSSRPAWRRPAKWILVGLAVAAVGVGVLETVVAVNRSNDFNALPDNCMDDGNGHIRGGARCEQVDHDQTVATWAAAIGYGLGAAFTATGLVLHLTEPHQARSSTSARVTWDASVSVSGASCMARW